MGVYVPAMRMKMLAWSSLRSAAFDFGVQLKR